MSSREGSPATKLLPVARQLDRRASASCYSQGSRDLPRRFGGAKKMHVAVGVYPGSHREKFDIGEGVHPYTRRCTEN